MTPAMRIAYVCADRGVPVIGRSGSSTHICEFVRALVGHGHAATLFAATPGDGSSHEVPPCPLIDLSTDPVLHELRGRTAKALRAGGHTGPRAAEIYSLLLNQTLLQELTRRRDGIDLVYERHSLWSFAGLQFSQQAGVPFVLEVNAPLALQQEQYRQLEMAETAAAIEGLLLSAADLVIVTTPTLQEYVRARGASRRRIRVIPCGVSTALFPASGRAGTRSSETFVLGFVGSLKPWHGVEILLEAFLQLTFKSGRYRLLIVGDGPLAPYVQEFCQRHHLSDVVALVGSVDRARVPEYLAKMDVGLAPYPVLPSFYFSPLKIWEYAAAGVPIVASASGGLPTLFPHKVAAMLHEPGNVGRIVKHVERLRREPQLASKLAQRARRMAQRHTWERLGTRFASLAQRALAAHTRCASPSD